MDTIEIVNLKPNDWQRYKNLRLRALKEEPSAFASKYQVYVDYLDTYWIHRLKKAAIGKNEWLLFAKINENIIGMIGAFSVKEPHNAHITSVYVVPEKRRKGISKILMQSLLNGIKTNKLVKKITVDVNPEQLPAFNLYKNSGFELNKQYKMILGDGKEHDVYQLQMVLDKK